MNKQIFKSLLVWVIALVLLGGAGYWAVSSDRVDLSRFQNGVPSEGLMARVNGESIQTALFEKRFEQTKKSYEARGTVLQEKDTEMVRQLVLNSMINELLLSQYGKKQGMRVDEQTIENEYQQIVSQFPSQEEFEKHLVTLGAASEDVRSVISVQLMVQQIIDKQVAEHPIEVSEEEMRQVHNKAVESGAKVPPFEEVKSDIEGQLRKQKIGQLMDALVEQLRTEGAIEILG